MNDMAIPAPTMKRSAITGRPIRVATVAIGDYCTGAAALINSLASCGFTNEVFVGHVGPLAWKLAPDSSVTTIELNPRRTRHATNLKAQLLEAVGDGDVCYIDADCISLSPRLMEIVEEFLDFGAFFTVESILPASDVRHLTWARLMNRSWTEYSGRNFSGCVPYINAGFFGLRLPRDRYYLDEYSSLIERALPDEGEPFTTPYFPLVDQDCLNAVVGSSEKPYATLGPPDIWYRALAGNSYSQVGVSTQPLLLHCTGISKPWRLHRPPLSRPDIFDKAFYRFAYVETPWVTLDKQLPRSVVRWIEDGTLSKASLKARRIGARVSHVARTLVGSAT